MTQALHDVFSGLEMTQYLGAFLEQGFDTWASVLDITEPDLYVETPLSDNLIPLLQEPTDDRHALQGSIGRETGPPPCKLGGLHI